MGGKLRIVSDLELSNHWNDWIRDLPGSHFLQTREWATIKSSAGWTSKGFLWEDDRGKSVSAALVMERKVSLAGIAPVRILYVPRGPMLNWDVEIEWFPVLQNLVEYAQKMRAMFIKIDPECITGRGVPVDILEQGVTQGSRVIDYLKDHGWRYSQDQIQFRNTVWLDLSGTEEELLARFKQKTRYNVRLAARKGISIRTGTEADFPELFTMYAETSLRDGFVIRSRDYYDHVWRTFLQQDMGVPLIAEFNGQPIAGLFLVVFGGRAWYLYGMSRDLHREKMPTYLLQWEAIREAKKRGCTNYDLWGAPDRFDESEPMWGVYRFKEGLGGEVVRFIGAWDYPVNPGLYKTYTQWMPKIMNVLRRRGMQRTRQEVSV